ncbi:MAG: T9SS type A sorting domain-containing protein [Flavobacteriales bacterium]
MNNGLVASGVQHYRILGAQQGGTLQVLNTLGQLVRSIPLQVNGEGTEPFALEGLSPGIYLLQFGNMPAIKLGVAP